MRLSVIIINYNVCFFLEQCLYTVLAAAEGLETEIIVIDNASNDKSRDLLPQKFPGVKFYWKSTNTGFAKANNEALSLVNGEYILLLNPDTLITENSLKACLSFFETHPRAGALGMKMYDGAGNYLPESKRGLPDSWTSFFKMSGLIRLFPRHPRIARYYLGHLSENGVQEVEVLTGAFMMIPRKVFEIVGGLDERFFMYGEDIDWSYRIRKAGFRNYYLPEPGIIHFKGESSSNDPNYTRNFYGAMKLFVEKHHGQDSRQWLRLMNMGISLKAKIAGPQKRNPGNGYENRNICWEVIGDKEAVAEIRKADFNKYTSSEGGRGNGFLYCIGKDFGLTQALNHLLHHSAGAPVRFHIRGTSSVVGSDNKNSRGEVVLLN